MMERIRAGLFYLKMSISAGLQGPRRIIKPCCTPVKGNVRSVIVVKPADPMFAEACFVLSDEYIRESGCGHEALLRQAREAANMQAGGPLPGLRPGVWRIPGYLLSFLAGAGLCALLFYASL